MVVFKVSFRVIIFIEIKGVNLKNMWSYGQDRWYMAESWEWKLLSKVWEGALGHLLAPNLNNLNVSAQEECYATCGTPPPLAGNLIGRGGQASNPSCNGRTGGSDIHWCPHYPGIKCPGSLPGPASCWIYSLHPVQQPGGVPPWDMLVSSGALVNSVALQQGLFLMA